MSSFAFTIKHRSAWAVMLFTAAIASHARAELITGLTTSNQLVRFDSATPGSILSTVGVMGLGAGQSLVGIDLRPVDKALVGLGYDSSTSMAQVYTLDRATGNATSISAMFPLVGTGFGFDFNPVPGALRIVTNGTGVDNNFRITMGGAGVINIDGRIDIGGIEDPALGLVAAAYANNVPGGNNGQTTLYVVDGPSGLLYTQGTANFPPGTSPNTGSLFLVGSLGLGTGLPVNTGFDISGFTGNAFLSVLSTGATTTLYSVDLGGGTTPLGSTALGLADITVDPVPEPATAGLMALGLGCVVLVSRKLRSSRV